MPSIGITMENKVKKTGKEYTAGNREKWRKLGIRMMTCPVHDKDRKLVMAECEVRRCKRLVDLTEEPDASMEHLRQIAMSNQVYPPDSKKVVWMRERAEGRQEGKLIAAFLDEAKRFKSLAMNVTSDYDGESKYEKRTREEAQIVAYNNLSTAYLKLALVYANQQDGGSIETGVFKVSKEGL